MRTDVLLFMDSVEIEKGIKLPDLIVSSGDVLWLEMDNILHSDVFIAFLLGLFEIKQGRAFLAGADLRSSSNKIISYIDIDRWNPKVEDLADFIKLMAYSYDLQVSSVLSEFKRILNGLGGGYALNIKIEQMAVSTKRTVSTAATLAMPSLLLVLVEPFLNLEDDGVVFLKKEIKRIALDGSSFMILSEYEPVIHSKHQKMDLRV